MSIFNRLALAALAVLATACTVKETEAPAMTGPSELALRVAMQVVPDSILQDGASQAVLQIDAARADGQAVRGLGLRVATVYQGVVQDFGTLSAKTVVTGDDGRARVVYTAPPRPLEPSEQGNVVTLVVEPIGNDYQGETTRRVELRLVTPGVILPPNTPPQPNFTYSPTGPLPLTDIVFDASTTMDEGQPCGASCNYRWEFGDGASASGIFVRHQYRVGGTYQVRLTATDGRGSSATIAQALTVGPAEPPTASFVFSPTAPDPGQTIFFNAEASRPATGRRLVSYEWDFGSGIVGSGITTSKAYNTAGNYTITLTVTDDAGEKGTVSRSVQVGTPVSLTAALAVSPVTTLGAPAPLSTIFLFDAGASAGPLRIVEYRFNFGDGSTDSVQTTAVAEHRYLVRGAYLVTVRVRDTAGRISQAQVTVYVQ